MSAKTDMVPLERVERVILIAKQRREMGFHTLRESEKAVTPLRKPRSFRYGRLP